MTWNARRTVTIVLYRKWRVRARSRSMDTAAKVRKDTPDVIHPDVDWNILSVQYALKFSTSSATLNAAKNGWHIRPTRRSEAVRQPNRMKDGECRSWVFRIANRIKKFPTHVIRESTKLRTQVTIFVMKTSSVLFKLLSKKKQVFSSVLFMTKKSFHPQLRWSC